ncbi:MAG: hypothetical protein K0R31_1313 [Clostridiales bacterium]|jgi:hypothetical protein|nr:hypothetical protein [Clostridiales bacterium]
MVYLAFQLVILVGLLTLGIYIIFTDEEINKVDKENEALINSNETCRTKDNEEIKFPDIAYIQCDCLGCERCMQQEDIRNQDDNITIVWEDL